MIGKRQVAHREGAAIDRRRLAREAVAGGWSVRELESRARGRRSSAVTPGRSRRRGGLHPDQEAAIVEINDTLEAALGRDVEVTATAGGYRAHLTFDSVEEAVELARRLRPRLESSPSGD